MKINFKSVDLGKLSFELSQEFGKSRFNGADVTNPMELYPLMGSGEITNSYCGNFSGVLYCDNVALHELIGKRLGLDYSDGVFVRKVHFNCGKALCPACYLYGSVKRLTYSGLARLEATSKMLEVSSPKSSQIEHLVVSISPADYGITDEKVLRAKAVKALEELGFIGGVLIFHGSRRRKFEQIKSHVFRQVATDWSPHYHVVGFLKDGYKCRNCERKSNCLAGCGGFDDRRWQYYQKTGIYVKVLGERKTVKGTLSYQLGHASIRQGVKRACVTTWLGVCSYRRLKLKVEKKKAICPICQYELKRGLYSGSQCFVTARDAFGYVRDTIEKYHEDGVIVWCDAPKNWFMSDSVKSVGDEPRYGSMEWLRSVRKRSFGSYG